jgi:Flp pilus assembly pilin Flp
MTAMRRLARRLLVEDAAATAIEYALLAALIGGVIIATVAGMGQTLGGIYSQASTGIAQPAPTTP